MAKIKVENLIKNIKNKDLTSKMMVMGLVISAFFIGTLWQKVQFYESGNRVNNVLPAATGNVPSGANLLTVDALKGYAKDIGLDTNKFNSCLDGGKYKDTVAQETKEGESLGVNGTPGFFINGKFLGGAFPFDTFKEIIDKELDGTGSTSGSAYSQSLQGYITNNNFNPTPKTVNIGNSPVKGNQNAKVTIIEYSDFECPFCQRFYADTLGKIQTEYINTGKVKFTYKQFPLISIHPNAQNAAIASLCANEQGKFWEYHDKVFNTTSGITR